MRSGMTQRVLQFVYDFFYGNGGTWPALADLQRFFDRQGKNVNTAQIVQRIPATLLLPVPSTDGYVSPAAKLMLTVEGIERCARSGEDIKNFVAVVDSLAERMQRGELSHGQDDRSVRITIRQLAEAASLSLKADEPALHRLMAMLIAEGLIQDNGGKRDRRWTFRLRPQGDRDLSGDKEVLRLSEDQEP
jgi:hypothetical protein